MEKNTKTRLNNQMSPETPTSSFNLFALGSSKKIYISLAIFGVIAILLIVLIIFPLFNKIKKNSEELLFQKNNLSSLTEEIKNLENSKNLYDARLKDLEKIDELFIDKEIPIEFINFLEKEASQSQLSIEVSSIVAPKKESEPWPSLSFQIETTGSFSNFLKFLEKLENSPYLIEILNLNLKRLTKEGDSSANINATFSIKVFTK